MTQEDAETLALQALGWMAQQDDLLAMFLGSSGISEGDLKHGAGDAELLAAVLDFLLMDDRWVADFCRDRGLPPETLARARVALPGGAQVHWT